MLAGSSKKKAIVIKKKELIQKIGIGFIFLLGLVMLFNENINKLIVKNNIDRYSIKHFNKEMIVNNQKSSTKYDYDSISLANTKNIVKSQFNSKNMPVIGAIGIPSVNVNLPILKGITNSILLTGAGTLFENQEMGKGNYVLASHRMKDPTILFSPLDRVEEGFEIYITDLINVYTYISTDNFLVSPSEVSVVAPTDKNILTLITCGDSSGSTRRIVKGKLVESKKIDEVDKKILNYFHLNEEYKNPY